MGAEMKRRQSEHKRKKSEDAPEAETRTWACPKPSSRDFIDAQPRRLPLWLAPTSPHAAKDERSNSAGGGEPLSLAVA